MIEGYMIDDLGLMKYLHERIINRNLKRVFDLKNFYSIKRFSQLNILEVRM